MNDIDDLIKECAAIADDLSTLHTAADYKSNHVTEIHVRYSALESDRFSARATYPDQDSSAVIKGEVADTLRGALESLRSAMLAVASERRAELAEALERLAAKSA